ncbi:protein Ycf2-like [Pecten maximus]|uniref:protein Ycf2-like n=1 Tax=Pecten maximus TaxID=6579 RepID=UPI001458D10A|nr:protein Ycf2-like [Pecten maximus]XP_033757194.1 protein Ycf2-like [Pecten maximus]
MALVIELLHCLPPTSVSCETTFSQMKLIKTSRRISMSNETLNNLLLVKLQSPCIPEFNPKDSIDDWLLSSLMPRRPHYRRSTGKREKQTDLENVTNAAGTAHNNIDEIGNPTHLQDGAQIEREDDLETEEIEGIKEGETQIEGKNEDEIEGKNEGETKIEGDVERKIEGETEIEGDVERKIEGDTEIESDVERKIEGDTTEIESDVERKIEGDTTEIEGDVERQIDGEWSREEDSIISEEEQLMRLDLIFGKDADDFDYSEDYQGEEENFENIMMFSRSC